MAKKAEQIIAEIVRKELTRVIRTELQLMEERLTKKFGKIVTEEAGKPQKNNSMSAAKKAIAQGTELHNQVHRRSKTNINTGNKTIDEILNTIDVPSGFNSNVGESRVFQDDVQVGVPTQVPDEFREQNPKVASVVDAVKRDYRELLKAAENRTKQRRGG